MSKIDMTDVINPMTQAECAEWRDALESGKYRQAQEVLSRGSGASVSHCCLGVEKRVHPKQCRAVASGNDRDEELLKHRRGNPVRLPISVQGNLAAMNDCGTTFSAIAQHIRKEILPVLPE